MEAAVRQLIKVPAIKPMDVEVLVHRVGLCALPDHTMHLTMPCPLMERLTTFCTHSELPHLVSCDAPKDLQTIMMQSSQTGKAAPSYPGHPASLPPPSLCPVLPPEAK